VAATVTAYPIPLDFSSPFRVGITCYLCASLSFVSTHQAYRYRYACKAQYQTLG
jgi:hypothetical protein